METIIMAISVDLRSYNAPKLQEVLTKHGCIIKMRLGLHETSVQTCSERGLILLQLCANDDEINKLKVELENHNGISVNTMKI